MQGIFMLGTAIEVKCDGKWENKTRIKNEIKIKIKIIT